MSSAAVEVFFYGLFMDAELLRSRGLTVLDSQPARLDGYDLRIGSRATLVAAPGHSAHGILMSVPAEDLQRLYSDPGVSFYVPQAVEVTAVDGRLVTATCYNLPEALQDSHVNREYAQNLLDLALRLGLPADYRARIRSIAEKPLLSFRKAEMSEAERIAALVNSGYRGESSKLGWTTEADLLDGTRTNPADIENMIGQPGSMVLLCVEGANFIGTAHLERQGDECQLGMLVVKPGLQGGGIGKLLMQAAEEKARETWGVRRIAMSVISIRHELIAYYERRGYRRTGRTRPFVADDTHGYPKSQPIEFEVMEKQLP